MINDYLQQNRSMPSRPIYLIPCKAKSKNK
nr:MAG TPA: hypothetical protein [Caudoviricetes sp.]